MKAGVAVTRGAMALSLLSAAWSARAECLLSAESSASAIPVQAQWVTEPATVQVGEPFVLMVELCPATAQLVGVDASMPEHRHGMNYKPSFKPMGDGLWRVEGMVWHMAGRWELRIDTRLDGTAHILTPSIILK